MTYETPDLAGHLFVGPRPPEGLIDVDPSDIVAPFPVRRVYWIFDTAPEAVRGKHAHRNLKQLAMAVAGACTFVLEDKSGITEVRLDDPAKGLLIGPGVWREMKDFSPDCVITVLASLPYEEDEYIRDFAEFQATLARPSTPSAP
jgi:hypothetical protein